MTDTGELTLHGNFPLQLIKDDDPEAFKLQWIPFKSRFNMVCTTNRRCYSVILEGIIGADYIGYHTDGPGRLYDYLMLQVDEMSDHYGYGGLIMAIILHYRLGPEGRMKYLDDLYRRHGAKIFKAQWLLDRSTDQSYHPSGQRYHPWLVAFILKHDLLPHYQVYNHLLDTVEPGAMSEFFYKVNLVYTIDPAKEGFTEDDLRTLLVKAGAPDRLVNYNPLIEQGNDGQPVMSPTLEEAFSYWLVSWITRDIRSEGSDQCIVS